MSSSLSMGQLALMTTGVPHVLVARGDVRKAAALGCGKVVELGMTHLRQALVAAVELAGIVFRDGHGLLLLLAYTWHSRNIILIARFGKNYPIQPCPSDERL